jgi:peptidyl-prolyl cis-trans isomerase SurA
MTKTLLASLLLTGTCLTSLQAQTLFTYGGKPVGKAEFLRIYQKNATQQKADRSEKALRDYLELYSLFRMKVSEAEAQQLDTSAAIQGELENYRRQLSRSYLSDPSATEKLMQEAYQRMQTNVAVAHILIPVPSNGDTAAAYQRADSLYKVAIRKGSDFGALARAFSTDRGSKDNGGKLGYITGLQTIYPFETVAYNTPVGKVAPPFRTQFGYHILKVLDRKPSQGEVEVQQIMALTPKSKGEEGIAAARLTIDSARRDLAAAMSWNDAVKKYSQDKFSSDNNGLLKPFGIGRTAVPFEEAAFALKKPGDLSGPVQTDFGIHLLRLVRRIPIQPMDSMRDDLRRRIDNDSRSQIAKDRYTEQVKAKYGFVAYPEALKQLISNVSKAIPDSGKGAGRFTPADFRTETQPLFRINNTTFTGADFMRFVGQTTNNNLMGNQELAMQEIFNLYTASVLNDFQIQSLERDNAEFRNLLTEYRDGILLFDLMDRNVWSKASKDTVGLTAFYNAHKDKYRWEDGFEGTVFRFGNKPAAEEAVKMMASGLDSLRQEALLTRFNLPNTPPAVTITQQGTFEWSRFPDFTRQQLSAGKPSPIKANTDGSYTVVYMKRPVAAGTPKTLAEARGYVVAEYQDALEKAWNERLRQQYPVKVETKVLNTLVQ